MVVARFVNFVFLRHYGDQALHVADEPDFLNASDLVCNFLDFISTYELSVHLCGFFSAHRRSAP